MEQFHFWVFIQMNWKQGLSIYLHFHGYWNIIHNSQKMEANQVSIIWWMDKEHVVCT